MACNNGTCSTNGACNCQNTSYTIPTNAIYGDSTCRQPTETCEDAMCFECVRGCHGEDKWCTLMPVTNTDGESYNVDFCIHRGERLDQMLQKLTLAQSFPGNYPYTVKNFYVDWVKGGSNPSIKFIWFEYSQEVSGISMFVAAAGSDEFFLLPWFEQMANPLNSNTAILDSTSMPLESGNTYKFKLVTSANGLIYNPGSVILHVTIP